MTNYKTWETGIPDDEDEVEGTYQKKKSNWLNLKLNSSNHVCSYIYICECVLS